MNVHHIKHVDSRDNKSCYDSRMKTPVKKKRLPIAEDSEVHENEPAMKQSELSSKSLEIRQRRHHRRHRHQHGVIRVQLMADSRASLGGVTRLSGGGRGDSSLR